MRPPLVKQGPPSFVHQHRGDASGCRRRSRLGTASPRLGALQPRLRHRLSARKRPDQVRLRPARLRDLHPARRGDRLERVHHSAVEEGGQDLHILLSHPPVYEGLGAGERTSRRTRTIRGGEYRAPQADGIVLSLAAAAASVALAAFFAFARGTETVEVADDFLEPRTKVTIEKNDKKVAFNWTGTKTSTTSSRSERPRQVLFQSGELSGSGVLFKRKFKEKGTYDLICSIHEDMLMDLKVKRKRRN